MTTVLFFSRHQAQDTMVKDLGGKIDSQFKGTISNIRRDRESGMISFTETIGFGEEQKTENHVVDPNNSIFVVVAPLPIQAQWLQAGVKILLAPQNNRIVDSEGNVTFNYSGLLHIQEIKVVSEQWAGVTPSFEQKAEERAKLG